MYRSIITSIFGLFLFFPALINAQSVQLDTAKTLMYKVSGKGLKSTSYLYGTIHAICQDDLQLHDSVFSVLPRCKSLVLETNSDALDDSDVIRLCMMKGDTSLKMLLSKEKVDAIQSFYMKRLSMTIDGEARFKPMIVSLMAITQVLNCPAMQIASVENVLEIEAKKHNLKNQYLETPEFQLEMLDSISYKEQAEQLHYMVTHFDASKKSFASLTSAYQSMDLVAIDSLSQVEDGGLRNEPALLENRNRTWIGKLKTMMAKEPCFIAVGAAHLAGKESVVHLLRKEGYTVEPVLRP